MQFHSVSGAIETVCPISGTSEEENNLKAIASMLQVKKFKSLEDMKNSEYLHNLR